MFNLTKVNIDFAIYLANKELTALNCYVLSTLDSSRFFFKYAWASANVFHYSSYMIEPYCDAKSSLNF